MKIAFLGTPDFALPSLRALVNAGHEIVGVFSQPDRPKGRKMELAPTPVKALALELGLPVYQFDKIRSEQGQQALASLAPELMVTAAFGQILSAENLAVPKRGCINVHASLLPKYRGAAPIQWAVINGETATGVTTMLTDVGLDTGDILMQSETAIGPEETAGELFRRLSLLGAIVLTETIKHLDSIKPREQDEALATHFPMLKKEDGRIDFTKDARSIVNLVRGTNPWPGAFATLEGEPHGGETVKVHKARALEGAGGPVAPGAVLEVTKEGVAVGAGGGAVELLEVQPQGKKRMGAADWARGVRDIEKMRFA